MRFHTDDIDLMLRAVSRAATWMDDMAEDGPDVRKSAHLDIVAAAGAVSEAPDEIEKAADVAIALVALCERNGWLLGDLAAAVAAQVSKNAARTALQPHRQTDPEHRHVQPA